MFQSCKNFKSKMIKYSSSKFFILLLILLEIGYSFEVILSRSLKELFSFSNGSISMSFANKNITSIEDFTFSGYTNSQNLYLGDNGLISIDKNNFNGLKGLIDLALNANRLTSINSNTFDNLKSLEEELHLEDNKQQ